MIQSECNITGVKRGEKKKKIPFSSNTTKNIHIKCNITGSKRGERKGRSFQFQWNLMTEACRERNRVNSELGNIKKNDMFITFSQQILSGKLLLVVIFGTKK